MDEDLAHNLSPNTLSLLSMFCKEHMIFKPAVKIDDSLSTFFKSYHVLEREDESVLILHPK
jgi:hypothetical protein